MTAEQFTYWLQGYLEIENPDNIPLNQTQIIKDHLNLVFNKVTPDRETTPTTPGVTGPYTTPLTPILDWDPYKPSQTNPYTINCDIDKKSQVIC